MLWGASTVKWTTMVACVGLSGRDSKLYTNLKFCDEISIFIFFRQWSTKPSNSCLQILFKKSLHILEDGGNGEQVGDVEQVII